MKLSHDVHQRRSEQRSHNPSQHRLESWRAALALAAELCKDGCGTKDGCRTSVMNGTGKFTPNAINI